MTLILSALTQEYVIQVSDRRLTDFSTGKPKDEGANKAILFCGHIIFGYTGLAEIGKQKTDFWLAERLLATGPSAQAAVELVKEEATKAFKTVPVPWKKHAFVGVGWSRSRPILCVISNFIDAEGNRMPEARDNFSLQTVAVTQPLRVYSVGQVIPEKMRLGLYRTARQAVSRGALSAMVRLLVNQVRTISSQTQTVGDDAMVSIIPRAAVPVRLGMSLSPRQPSKEAASFFYVPTPDDNTPRFYVPLSVCGAMAVGSGEVWMGEQPPPWWKD